MSYKTLKQGDSRWGHLFLGFSKTTIKDYGCTLTVLAMALGIDPDVLNRILIKGNAFKNNLIWWTQLEKATNGALKFHWRGYGWDQKRVLEAIGKYGFALAEIDFDNNPRTIGNHWILLKGDKKANDPYSGDEIKTSKYTDFRGFAILEVDRSKLKVKKEPMAEPQEKPVTIQIEKNDFEKLHKNSVTLDELADVLGIERNPSSKDLQIAFGKMNQEVINDVSGQIKAKYTRELSNALGDEISGTFDSLVAVVKGLNQQANQPQSANGDKKAGVPTSNNKNDSVSSKKWYESKTVWFNFAMTIINTAGFVISMAGQLSEVAVLTAVMIQGVGNIILRAWFTDKPIDTSNL